MNDEASTGNVSLGVTFPVEKDEASTSYPIVEDGKVVGIVCSAGPMEEIVREPDGERWCFTCRKRRSFEYVVIAPVEPSYYGPNPSIRCSACDTDDGDLFPGRFREWTEG